MSSTHAQATIPLDPDEKSFLLREHESLREELKFHFETSKEFPKWAILSSAAIWTWLATRPAEPASGIVRFMPALVCFVLFVSAIERTRSIHALSAYIERIEQRFPLSDGLGWESTRWKAGRPSFLGSLTWAFWCFVMIGNLLLALFLRFTYVPTAGK